MKEEKPKVIEKKCEQVETPHLTEVTIRDLQVSIERRVFAWIFSNCHKWVFNFISEWAELLFILAHLSLF